MEEGLQTQTTEELLNVLTGGELVPSVRQRDEV